MTLLEKTKELLKEDGRTLLDIHLQSNIPFYWLQKFPHSKDPSVNRVEKLYNFLSKEKLKV
jgi:predicted transcriptional regulator